MFRTSVRRKETAMLTVLIAALGYAAVRIALSALRGWRELPRTNDDMVFF